jgi:hypothetical protein
MNIELGGTDEIYMQLRTALKQAADRDCSPQTCSVLEQMLDRGSLHYHRDGVGFWSVSDGGAYLAQIHGVKPLVESLFLELFIEHKFAFCTEREPDGPGIYWFAQAARRGTLQ